MAAVADRNPIDLLLDAKAKCNPVYCRAMLMMLSVNIGRLLRKVGFLAVQVSSLIRVFHSFRHLGATVRKERIRSKRIFALIFASLQWRLIQLH